MKEIKLSLNFPIFSLATLVLAILKLTSVIHISWWWIVACFFAPWLIALAVAGLAVVVVLAGVIFAAFIEYRRANRRYSISYLKPVVRKKNGNSGGIH